MPEIFIDYFEYNGRILLMPKTFVDYDEKYPIFEVLRSQEESDSYNPPPERNVSSLMLTWIEHVTLEYQQLQAYLARLHENEMKIPEGYHPRVSGAGRLGDGLVCSVCRRQVSGLIGYENSYPDHPDLWVCSECEPEPEVKIND